MKDKKILYCIFALIPSIVSCNVKNENKVVSIDYVLQDTNSINQQSHLNILDVSKKMQEQNKLAEIDYDCICDFLFNNSDESISEEIGYQLFEYLQSKTLHNTAFISYLNVKESTLRESVLVALIQAMCIDIGEENYSYDTFIKDFDMFRNSAAAKKTFEECMNNQVFD
jgi:hypothetical protein